jgi:peptidoglycan hydrolase CwlO-like protein
MNVTEFRRATVCLALELPESVYKSYAIMAAELAGGYERSEQAIAAANEQIAKLKEDVAFNEHRLSEAFERINNQIEHLREKDEKIAKLQQENERQHARIGKLEALLCRAARCIRMTGSMHRAVCTAASQWDMTEARETIDGIDKALNPQPQKETPDDA